MYSFAAARGCALGRPRKRGTGGGGGGAPKESLSRGVLLKSSLTDKILSFHFHDPNQERMISFSLAQIHFILPT